MKQFAKCFTCKPRTRSSICPNRVCTAVIGPPLRIPITITSISLLGYICARPLVGLWLSFVARARVSLKGLWINPLQRRAELSGVHVKGRDGVPLGGMDSAVVNVGRGLNNERKRQWELTVVKPNVIAVFDGIDFRTSNWTRWLGQWEQTKGKEERRDVKVNVQGGVRVSVWAGGQKVVDEVKLEGVKVKGLGTVDGIGKYVDGWVGKTLENGKGRIEKQFKKGVRRYVRRVGGGFQEGLRVSRERVKLMREGLEFVEEFVLKDLPNTGRMSDQVQGMRNVLGGIEGLLKSGDEEEDQSNVTKRRSTGDDNSVGGYRELDEGDAKY